LAPHSLNKPNIERSSSQLKLKRKHSGKTLGRENVIMGSSDTEDESQVPDAAYLASVPSPVPIVLYRSTPVLPKAVPLPGSETDGCNGLPNYYTTPDTKRPKKIRRLSPSQADDPSIDPTSSRRDVGGWSIAPEHKTPQAMGAGTEKDAVVTPAADNTSKLSGDYSAYKGRGRYAVDVSKVDKTINALYAIDPERNGGLDYQFDEVVRTRDDRRKMDAGDCECCREYYEAVGPLPKRLQQPLWRSPPNTPVKPCQQHQSSSTHTHAMPISGPTPPDAEFDVDALKAISDHKQAISRHRHRWARASTPPGYWSIGFPSTQEAADINKRAKEMHRAKRDSVEGEIKRGDGKYKRR